MSATPEEGRFRHCPQCGGLLERVGPKPAHMSEDQWDDAKAGDYYCTSCPGNGRGNVDLAYWNESEVSTPEEDRSEPPDHSDPHGYKVVQSDHVGRWYGVDPRGWCSRPTYPTRASAVDACWAHRNLATAPAVQRATAALLGRMAEALGAHPSAHVDEVTVVTELRRKAVLLSRALATSDRRDKEAAALREEVDAAAGVLRRKDNRIDELVAELARERKIQRDLEPSIEAVRFDEEYGPGSALREAIDAQDAAWDELKDARAEVEQLRAELRVNQNAHKSTMRKLIEARAAIKGETDDVQQ